MQNFPRRIINKTFGNLNIRVYRGKFGYVLAIISEQSVNSFPFLAFIVLDPISEIFEQKEIRFPYNSLQFCRLRFSLHDFTVRKKRVFYEFPSSLSLFFFEKKREVNILTIPLQKKEEKEGRGGPLIVFIFT